MIIKFWGVRGSTPVPDRRMCRYGGNTSCISVEIENKVLILDAGTGIRSLGEALLGTEKEIFILLTHLHGDHIIGFPFFGPLYEQGQVVHLLDYRRDGFDWSLLKMLDGLYFPLRPDNLHCTCLRVEGDVLYYLHKHGFEVACLPMNHPGGAYGYRIEHQGRTLVFMPDNELDPQAADTAFDSFVAFCRGADVLCHDAQYLPSDMPVKQGWGHSLVNDTCQLAVAAGVKHLVLFHHDPARSDEAMDEVQIQARRLLDKHGIACTAAYEGLILEL